MATMTEPKAENKTLVHFMVEGGVAIIELDDAPANTYTYEMMRQLDEAILRARFDDDVHVVVLRGHGEARPQDRLGELTNHLDEAILRARFDDDVHVVVLRVRRN